MKEAWEKKEEKCKLGIQIEEDNDKFVNNL